MAFLINYHQKSALKKKKKLRTPDMTIVSILAFSPVGENMIIKSQGNKQADKEWEVGDEEACVRTPGRCPSVAECQLSTCIEELLAPPPDRLSTRHFVSSNCAPWGNSGPRFTSSVSAAFFIFLLPDLHRKSLLSYRFLFIWHLLLNTGNRVKIGFSWKTSQEGLGHFQCLFSHPSSNLI